MMSEFKGTPGTWTISEYEGGRFPSELADHFVGIDGKGWGALAKVPVKVDGEPCAEGRANAALIAAAPELLEALQELLATCGGNGPVSNKARAAIAKALGKEDGQ